MEVGHAVTSVVIFLQGAAVEYSGVTKVLTNNVTNTKATIKLSHDIRTMTTMGYDEGRDSTREKSRWTSRSRDTVENYTETDWSPQSLNSNKCRKKSLSKAIFRASSHK